MPAVMVRALNRPGVVFALMLAALTGGAWFGWAYVKTGASIGWKTSQFFFSYQELGFVSRGLVASMLHPFPALLSAPGLIAVTVAMLLAFAVVWWRLLETRTRHLAPADRAALVAVCVLAPSMFLRMGFDYGRFDPLNVVLMIAAICALRRAQDWLAALIVSVALLVHEGFLVLEFPVVCASVLATNDGDVAARFRRLLRWVWLPGLVTGALLAWGKFEPGIDALAARFEANSLYQAAAPGGTVNRDALLVITRTLRENFEFNAAFFAERRPWGHLVFIAAWLFVYARWFEGFFARHALRRDWLYVAAYSPLLMSVIACDYFRWAALTSVNMLVVVVIKIDDLRRDGRTATVPWNLWSKLAVASCLLGPISNTKSFPLFFTVLEAISPWRIAW